MRFTKNFDDINTDEADVFGFNVTKDLGSPLGPTGETVTGVVFNLTVAPDSPINDPIAQNRISNTSIYTDPNSQIYILAFITFPVAYATYLLEGIATTSSGRVLSYSSFFPCTPPP